MTNTSTTVSFLQKSPESAERISNLAGTRAAIARTRQIVEEQGIYWNDRRYSGVESERETYEYNIHPDSIKCLSRGECVMVGKIPHAWHARVKIYSPAKKNPGIVPASEEQILDLLKSLKKFVERTPAGTKTLSLRKRAQDCDETASDSTCDEKPGLRIESVVAGAAQGVGEKRESEIDVECKQGGGGRD